MYTLLCAPANRLAFGLQGAHSPSCQTLWISLSPSPCSQIGLAAPGTEQTRPLVAPHFLIPAALPLPLPFLLPKHCPRASGSLRWVEGTVFWIDLLRERQLHPVFWTLMLASPTWETAGRTPTWPGGAGRMVEVSQGAGDLGEPLSGSKELPGCGRSTVEEACSTCLGTWAGGTEEATAWSCRSPGTSPCPSSPGWPGAPTCCSRSPKECWPRAVAGVVLMDSEVCRGALRVVGGDHLGSRLSLLSIFEPASRWKQKRPDPAELEAAGIHSVHTAEGLLGAGGREVPCLS